MLEFDTNIDQYATIKVIGVGGGGITLLIG